VKVIEPRAHAETIERLWSAAGAGRLPHALCFEGPAGIGKFQAALWFAQGCLCQAGPGRPCGLCPACKQVGSGGLRGNHPDLFVLDPSDPDLAPDFERGTAWRVHRIAHRPETSVHEPDYCVEHALELRALQGERRVLLLREAQRMNESAQNALLKTLEEPRDGTVILLETDRTAQLLPTILSRCIRIRFEPPSQEDCAAILETLGRTPEEARELARLGRGSPGRALEVEAQGLVAMRAALVEASLGRGAPLAAIEAIEDAGGTFAGGTPTARERARARAVAELAQALLMDALRVVAGQPAEELRHGPFAQRLAGLGAGPLRRRLEAVLLALQDLGRNLAPAPVLERIVLVLAEGPLALAPR
jgi:DNA polymerase-3 subunit delta'